MVLMGSFILPSSQDTRGRKADSSLFLDRSLRRHDPDQVSWVSAKRFSAPSGAPQRSDDPNREHRPAQERRCRRSAQRSFVFREAVLDFGLVLRLLAQPPDEAPREAAGIAARIDFGRSGPPLMAELFSRTTTLSGRLKRMGMHPIPIDPDRLCPHARVHGGTLDRGEQQGAKDRHYGYFRSVEVMTIS